MNLWTTKTRTLTDLQANPLTTYHVQDQPHKGKMLSTVVADTGTVQTAVATFVNDAPGAKRFADQQRGRHRKAQTQPFNAPKVAAT